MASGGDDSCVLGCLFADAFSECCPLELVREENERVLSGGCPPQAIEINVINCFLVTFQCLAERHLCVSDPWSDGREILLLIQRIYTSFCHHGIVVPE